MIEEDYAFQCPHCGVDNNVRLDATAGKKQMFNVDCEICCRSISIEALFDEEGLLSFTAEPDD